MIVTDEKLLRLAAQAVRERGSGTSPGPWSERLMELQTDSGNAAWIALVGPQLAEPLAAWLDEAAREIVDAADHMREHGQYVDVTADSHALAVAKVLLGEPAPTVSAPEGDEEKK